MSYALLTVLYTCMRDDLYRFTTEISPNWQFSQNYQKGCYWKALVIKITLVRVSAPYLIPTIKYIKILVNNMTILLSVPLGNGLPSWAPAAAIIPALLATILLFVDQHITALIVNRKDNKLKVSQTNSRAVISKRG